jgi:hypothetical protein
MRPAAQDVSRVALTPVVLPLASRPRELDKPVRAVGNECTSNYAAAHGEGGNSRVRPPVLLEVLAKAEPAVQVEIVDGVGADVVIVVATAHRGWVNGQGAGPPTPRP